MKALKTEQMVAIQIKGGCLGGWMDLMDVYMCVCVCTMARQMYRT